MYTSYIVVIPGQKVTIVTRLPQLFTSKFTTERRNFSAFVGKHQKFYIFSLLSNSSTSKNIPSGDEQDHEAFFPVVLYR